MRCRFIPLLLICVLLANSSPAATLSRPVSNHTGPVLKRVCPISIRYRQEIDQRITQPPQQSSDSHVASMKHAPLAAEMFVDEAEPLPVGKLLILLMHFLL